MIFFISTLSVSLILLSIASIFLLYDKINVDYFYKLSLNSFVNRQYKLCGNRYFCSYAILQTIKILRRKNAKKALINFAFGRIEQAVEILKKQKKEDIIIALKAHFSYEESLIEYERLIKRHPKNMFILGEMAELYYLTGQFSRLNMVLEKINEKKSLRYTKAKKIYYSILVNMKDGDLLPASIDGNNVIRLFAQEKAYIEEAKTYLLIGIMYKASTVFDTAQFMFSTALKAFKSLNDKIGTIEAYGNLAMLMSVQERYEEAESFLDKAQAENHDVQDPNILNQRGLNMLLKNDFDKAADILIKARDINFDKENYNSLGFSNEVLSYVKYSQKKYFEAIDAAQSAVYAYKKTSNISALLEAKHVQALSFYELDNFDDAEKTSREILEIAKNEQTSFHIANAYNLLGLIFIAKRDFERARALFKESLRQEQRNERAEGIATDYFNIGIIESKIGHIEDAKLAMENALEFASKYGNTKLSDIIKERLKTLS